MIKQIKNKKSIKLKEKICDALEGEAQGEYRILQAPNFFFPLADIGKKFKVINTYNLEVKNEDLIREYKALKKLEPYYSGAGKMTVLSKIFWETVKEYKIDEDFPDCWVVPIRLVEFGNYPEIEIDILEPVK